MRFIKLFLLASFFVAGSVSGQQLIKDLQAEKFKVVTTKDGSIPCPVMTETQRNGITSPAKGKCVFNSTTNKLNTYDGALWKASGGGVDAWATATVYTAGDLVIQSNKIYKALLNHTSGTFATDLANGDWVEVSQGVTDHTQLTNIGTNTHAQIDTHIANTSNPHSVTKAQVGLGNVANVDTTTTASITDSTNKRFVTDTEKTNIGTITGKQNLSAVTTKGDIYGATASATTTRVPVGPEGQVLNSDTSASTNLAYRQIKEDESVAVSFSGFDDTSAWSKGNSAVIMGGGAFAATLVRDTSTKISLNGSFKMTQAAGSLNDYFCTSPRNIYKNDKGDTFLSAKSTYDGSTGDIQPYLWDTTNSIVLNLAPVKALGASNSSAQSVYAVSIPDATNSVQICYQVKTLNSGKIFNVSQIQITKSLSSLGVVNNTNASAPQNLGAISITSTGTSPTKGTTTIDRMMFSRILNRALIEYQYNQSGAGSAGTGEYLFNLPVVNGVQLEFDTNTVTFWTGDTGGSYGVSSGAGQSALVGTGHVGGGSSSRGMCSLFAYSATQFRATCAVTFSAYNTMGTGIWSLVNANQGFQLNLNAPIKGWDVGNAQVASSNQITTSDTMVLVYKASAIVASDPVGTFNTYTYGTSTNNATITASAPTQSTASMNQSGIQLFGRPYNAASTAASPSRVDIKIGTGLNGVNVFAYRSAMKADKVSHAYFVPASSVAIGAEYSYSSQTGILTISGGINPSTVTSRDIVRDIDNGSSYSNAYFSFTASTQPNVSLIPNASLCSDYDCQDEFSWFISAAGAVTSTNKPGSLSCSGTTLATCVYSAALAAKITTPMICTSGAASWAAEFTTNTVTGFQVNRFNTVTGGAAAYATYVSCKKAWPDSKTLLYKIAGVTDVVAHYYIGSNQAVTSNTTPINFNVKVRDDYNMVTTVGGGLRATIPSGRAGRYSINAKASGTTVTAHSLSLYKNGVFVSEGTYGGYVQQISWDIDLLAGDYIEIRDGQSITLSGSATSSGFQMKRVEAF